MRIMVRAMKAYENDQKVVKNTVLRPRSSVDGMSLIKNPKGWLNSQLYGWKPDKDGNYHGIWKRFQNAEFKKLFIGDNLDIEEVESAISTIAFVSKLDVIVFNIMWTLYCVDKCHYHYYSLFY